MSKKKAGELLNKTPIIIIENSVTGEEFYSKLTDISVFEDVAIFTWSTKRDRRNGTKAC